jgi:hypothetical protein
VLTHIAEGLCNKEIGCRLNIGTRTVETHRERLMRKLAIHSIAGLTRFAIAKGLVTLPDMGLAWNEEPERPPSVDFCPFTRAAAC